MKKLGKVRVSYPVRRYTNQEIKEFLMLDKKETRKLNVKKDYFRKKVKSFKILTPKELIEKIV